MICKHNLFLSVYVYYVINSTWHFSTEIAMKCIYAERNAKLHFMTFVIYIYENVHTLLRLISYANMIVYD